MARTILLVDDEFAFLEVLALLLQRAGFEVATASDGEDALVRLEEKCPDLVITDYWMPKMDGLRLFRLMQEDERWRDIPVILMTAAYDTGFRPPPGLKTIFPKPLHFPVLLEAVRKLLPQ